MTEPPRVQVMEKTSDDGLVVVHAALFRMATQSFAEAYRILGYKTHHGMDDILGNPWPGIEKSADATWPHNPGARPTPRFTRQDWDELWGNEYDITTDMACPFVDQLVEAYPNAKVVVVQRNFDTWWTSYEAAVLDKLFTPSARFFIAIFVKMIGTRAPDAMMKLSYGLFGAKNAKEIEANARKAYDTYYENIRKLVPAERRLEYRMGDGWEPLCEFLGKDVPDVPFPRLNDDAYRREKQRKGEMGVIRDCIVMAAPWVLGAAAIVAAVKYSRS